MAVARLTRKGQVTIPQAVRNALQLHSGTKLEFIITEKGELLLRPVTKSVDDLFGILHKKGRKPVSVDEMNAAIKERMKAKFK